MRPLSKLGALAASAYMLPAAILAIAILAYGLHIPQVGFYWDDWPWVWFSQVLGPGGMLKIDVEHRPISGLVLHLGTLLSGVNPLGWQIYNLFFRVLGCFSLAWMLRILWPKYKEQTNWVVLFFLVYPGFGQQFVAVNTSRHLFPLATFFISLGLMIKANQNPSGTKTQYWSFTLASLVFSFITMFTTEYYYGLELIRPLILWSLIRHRDIGKQAEIRAVVKSWLPYLLPLVGVFIWRFTISKDVNYQITIFENLGAEPSSGILNLLENAVKDILSAGLGVWGKLFHFPNPALYGPRSRLYYLGSVLLVTAGMTLYFFIYPSRPGDKKWGFEAIIIGLGALMVGPIPFWVTGLDIKQAFPFDRLTLPMMIGSSLLLTGILDLATRWKPVKVILAATIIGMSVGFHYQNGVTYRRDWLHQTGLFQQLAWRIPALKTRTTILANELPTTFSTDNSLTAPLNWMYAPNFSGGDLAVFLFYIDLRLGENVTDILPDSLVNDDYSFYSFRGSPDQALIIYNQPPACTRVLTLEYHVHFPGLPPEIQSILGYSNTDQIQAASRMQAPLPDPMDTGLDLPDWCYYFEKADLARQRGEWEDAARFSEAAFKIGYPDSPAKHVTENELFVEAYAQTGQWDEARQLTIDSFDIDPQMAPMLCDTWDRILSNTPPSLEKSNALHEIKITLGCD